jgi:hypothetical protein
MSGKPNHKHLPPIVQKLVELRAKLAAAKLLPQNYDNNLEVQKLNKRILDILDFPEVKPTRIA